MTQQKRSRQELFDEAYDACLSELTRLPDAQLRLAVLHSLLADSRDDIESLVDSATAEIDF